MATARWGGRNTNRRRWIQLAFLAVFVVLPLFDLFRFDFATSRLHLFRTDHYKDLCQHHAIPDQLQDQTKGGER